MTWYEFYSRNQIFIILDTNFLKQTLSFDNFQVILLFVAVLLVCIPSPRKIWISQLILFKVNYLIGDGKSHWLEGVLLMTMYLLIALAAWFY